MQTEMTDLSSILTEVVAAESGYGRLIETDICGEELIVNVNLLSIKRAELNMVVNAARYGNGWIKVNSCSICSRAVRARRQRAQHQR